MYRLLDRLLYRISSLIQILTNQRFVLFAHLYKRIFLVESLLQVWFIYGWLYLPDKVFEGISWKVELSTSFKKFHRSLNVHKFGWWFEQKSSTFNRGDSFRFGISALFHRWMVLRSGFCRVGWHNTSTTGILVWPLIPGTSIILDVSVLLVVKRISRVLSFLVSLSTGQDYHHTGN